MRHGPSPISDDSSGRETLLGFARSAIRFRAPGRSLWYRGVAGRGRDRRVRGLSWTGSIELASGFAQDHARRLEWCTFPDPGVYRITIAENAVLAYTNQDEEQEFVVMLPATVKPERVR
jgi:hypothetical protein